MEINKIQLNTIGEKKQGGQQGGESSIEYLDVSGLDETTKQLISMMAQECKYSSPSGNIVGPVLLSLDALVPLNTLISRVIQIKIDFSCEFNVMGQKGLFADFVNMVGLTAEQLDSIPRLTKEQFYSLD